MGPKAKENELKDIVNLKNTYYGMRHAESVANAQNLIASSFESQKGMGLTEKGQSQAKESIKINSFVKPDFLIFSSDFERAYETAKIFADGFGISVLKTPLLRDRFFGDLDGKNSENYNIVWEQDRVNPDYKGHNNESVLDVLKRTTQLIADLENSYSGRQIILVSHGDPLGILETLFKGIDPWFFRDLEKIPNAGIREFIALSPVSNF